MKRTIAYFGILCITVIIGLNITGCAEDLANLQNKKGSLIVSILSQDNIRTIQPETDMTVASYDISGIGPNSATFDLNNITEDSTVVNELVSGAWIVNVSAKNLSGSVIASGSQAFVINPGLTTTANVTVTPLNGKGTLNLLLAWPGTLSNPIVSATLTPQGGSTTNLQFTLAANSASFSSSDINAGYYLLSLKLKDGVTEIWGAVTAVRIVAGETTTGLFNTGSMSGNLDITIGQDLQNPEPLTLDGQYPVLFEGNDMRLVVSPLISNQWYLNGLAITGATSFIMDIGSSLAPGNYRLDVICVGNQTINSIGFSFRVIASVPEGTFHEHQSISELRGFDLGDVNRDGNLEIMANEYIVPAIYNYCILTNEGNGTFIKDEAATFDEATNRAFQKFIDINNDGYPDLLTHGRFNEPKTQAGIYRNNGDGSFLLHQVFTNIYEYQKSMVTDIDNDGDMDIVILKTGGYIKHSNIEIYKNDGNGFFSLFHDIDLPKQTIVEYAIALGDIDGNGSPDIVFNGEYEEVFGEIIMKFQVYQNDGNGSFTFHSEPNFDLARSWASFALGDVDNDGDKDLVIMGGSGSGVYKNNGSGSFSPFQPLYPNAAKNFALNLTDIDKDGDLDIIHIADDFCFILKNAGGGVFGPSQTIKFPSDYYGSQIRFGDVDNDGLVDFVLSMYDNVYPYGSPFLKVFKNR